jgi:hypothetical protein
MPLAPTNLQRLIAALLVGLLGSCGQDDDDYDVAVSWLINGLAPDSELCDRYQVESVRLTLLDRDRNRTVESSCSDRVILSDSFEYGGFITNRDFEYELLYRYRVDMLDGNGDVVAGYEGSFEAFYDNVTPVELPTLELFEPIGEDATLNGSFDVAPGPNAESCAAAGIDAVEVWLASAADTRFEDPYVVLSAPCEAGELSSGEPLLALGDYQAKYVAVDEELRVIAESEEFSVLVDGALDITLPAVRF